LSTVLHLALESTLQGRKLRQQVMKLEDKADFGPPHCRAFRIAVGGAILRA
tara:strand:+ start:736 stop:888 length:153 start_codon:yes stop_codon:yes gene_type:complete